MENNVENNKIIKELIYWLAFIIYEELVLSGLIFGAFPKTALMIILLSSPFAIFLSLLTSIFKRKVNVVISYVLTIGLCFVGGAQLVYYKIYEAILSFYSIVNGGQVTEFMTTILDEKAQNWIGLVLIF